MGRCCGGEPQRKPRHNHVTGQFVLTMFAALAQLERHTIVGRTTVGRDSKSTKDGDLEDACPMDMSGILAGKFSPPEIR